MEELEDDLKDPGRRNIFTIAKDLCLLPLRILTSPSLLRTYLRTILVLITSTALLALAVVAYTSFYLSYVPVRGIDVPVYLQFPHPHPQPTLISQTHRQSKFPYGVANVVGLVSRQKYDVIAEVTVPRSEANLAAGNWMVSVELRGPGAVGGGVKGLLGWEEQWDVDDYSWGSNSGKEKETTPQDADAEEEKEQKAKATVSGEVGIVLARSRRPAILTYRSWMTELAYRALRLPLYVAGLGHESETVTMRMMESVEFDKGWRNVPSSVRVELRSRHVLEVYSVHVRFRARLEGLRWIMYNHRLASFVVFTTSFWVVEMGMLITTWAIFTLLFTGGADVKEEQEDERRRKIKDEASTPATPKTEPGSSAPTTPLSDASRTFPTLSSQQPLHYSSGEGPKVKGERGTPKLEDIPAKTEAEADDEDEDEDADFIYEEPIPRTPGGTLTDSGIGTSMESSTDRSGIVRKRSGGKMGGDR